MSFAAETPSATNKGWGWKSFFQKRWNDSTLIQSSMRYLLQGLQPGLIELRLKPSNYPEEYQQRILQQNRLKRQQLFNGRMSKEWSWLQHQHLTEKHLASHKLTGHLWCVSVTNTMWIAWYELWTSQIKKFLQITQKSIGSSSYNKTGWSGSNYSMEGWVKNGADCNTNTLQKSTLRLTN